MWFSLFNTEDNHTQPTAVQYYDSELPWPCAVPLIRRSAFLVHVILQYVEGHWGCCLPI